MTLLLDAPPAVPATHQTRPEGKPGAGQEATELAASAGLHLDPWQAEALDVALGERADGRWAATEVGLICPRQNGKGSILEARELAGLFLFGERLILHSAHEFKTAAEAFLRIKVLIQQTPDLDRRVHKMWEAHGSEGLELKDGARLRFVARSKGSGRGFSGDCIILDEAYELSAKAVAALIPTLSARPNPQLWYTSSAPLDQEGSAVLRRLCKRGRKGAARLAYMEWCARQDAALDDRTEWASANPGLGVRVSEEFVETELGALSPDDFARERLGIWDEDESGNQIIPPEAWAACLDRKSGPTGPVSFALDVAPDRGMASIAVAGESGRGGVHVEVVEHKQGTAWLAERAAELQSRWGGKMAIAKGSPAWSLEDELLDAKVELLPVSTVEHAQACGALFDDIMEHRLRHNGGQPELDVAVAGADRRMYEDAWLWRRRTSSVDISPLVAVTLARWAAVGDRTLVIDEENAGVW